MKKTHLKKLCANIFILFRPRSVELCFPDHVDGLVQERRNFIANALELRLSCSNPSMWFPLYKVHDLYVHENYIFLSITLHCWIHFLVIHHFSIVSLLRKLLYNLHCIIILTCSCLMCITCDTKNLFFFFNLIAEMHWFDEKIYNTMNVLIWARSGPVRCFIRDLISHWPKSMLSYKVMEHQD